MASRLAFQRLSLSTTRALSPCKPIATPLARFARTHTRTMATAPPPGKFEFLVIAPDKPNAREKRLEVRNLHFEGMVPFREDGTWKTGGALLNSVPKDDNPASLDFMGSTIVVVAESVEQVREQLSKDIYATSGVWDMEKVQIYPFKCAFRNP